MSVPVTLPWSSLLEEVYSRNGREFINVTQQKIGPSISSSQISTPVIVNRQIRPAKYLVVVFSLHPCQHLSGTTCTLWGFSFPPGAIYFWMSEDGIRILKTNWTLSKACLFATEKKCFHKFCAFDIPTLRNQSRYWQMSIYSRQWSDSI